MKKILNFISYIRENVETEKSLWNQIIHIINNHKDEKVRKLGDSLLGQYNTAGGIIIKHELENFINKYKIHENYEEESEPYIEPEDCECKEELEESGIEYTKDFYWEDGVWVCEHCGMPQ